MTPLNIAECAGPSGSSEAERFEALDRLPSLGAPPEAQLNIILDCAQQMLGCPTALISIRDKHRQWFSALCGFEASKAPYCDVFCAEALLGDDIMVVPDATQDPRFQNTPPVSGAPNIRFFAGVPLRCGHIGTHPSIISIGTLCVIDRSPRVLRDEEQETLRRLGRLIENLLEATLSAAESAELAGARGQALADRNRWHHQFEQAERLVNIGSWRLDLVTAEIRWSPQTFAIFGLPQQDQAPELGPLLDFYTAGDREVLMQALDRAIDSGEAYDLETDIIDARGDRRRIRNVAEIEMIDGIATGLIGVFQDVTERYQTEKALERSAKVDDLTQIANRAGLNAHLDRACEEKTASNHQMAVLLIDLDNFKTLNDTYGHAAGDDVLKGMAKKLERHARKLGFAARLGGDEFVLVISNELALRDIRCLLARLLEDLRITVPGEFGEIKIAATIGACWRDADVRTRSELLKRADLALYGAKALGKGRAIVSGDMRPIMPSIGVSELRAAS